MTTKDNIHIIEALASMHPQAGCELHFCTPFQLLVAVILSAQCTDARVNKVTQSLFQIYNTPRDFASLSEEELGGFIFSCGFYRNKSRAIIAMSKELLDKYNGEVPKDFDALVTLPGVGRKTANVVMSVAFDVPSVPVDTHVNRVSIRLGLSRGKNVEIVEQDIMKAFLPEQWNPLHHYLIFHGRYVCHSRNPSCDVCKLSDNCEYYQEKETKKHVLG